MLRQGVGQQIAHHGKLGLARLRLLQEFRHSLEAVLAVEIVGVDDGKRLMDSVFGYQDGMGGAVRFHTLRVDREAFGNGVQLLKYIAGVNLFGIFAEDEFLEILFHASADDKHHAAIAGIDGILNRVVHDGFTVGTEVVQLL